MNNGTNKYTPKKMSRKINPKGCLGEEKKGKSRRVPRKEERTKVDQKGKELAKRCP
jgi:hypothetical protein